MKNIIKKISIFILSLIIFINGCYRFNSIYALGTYEVRYLSLVSGYNYNTYGIDITTWASTCNFNADKTIVTFGGFTLNYADELNSRDIRFTSYIVNTSNVHQLIFGFVVPRNSNYINSRPIIRFYNSNNYYNGGISSVVYNGSQYDVYSGHLDYDNYSDIDSSWNISGHIHTSSGTSSDNSDKILLSYTFGDNSVAPIPIIDYGELDIHYSTNIAGSGNAINQNQDVLTWSSISSTGEDLSNGVLELRLVPGIYSSSDKSTLLTQLYSDFVVDYTNIYYLDSIPLSNGSYAMTWEEIYKHLDSGAAATNPLYKYLAIQYTGEYWQKVGWIWQYRVYIDDDYLDEEYTTIYTATSSGVSNSENIINATTYNYDLQTTINNINNVNNDTTNNYWYYQTINIPNTTPTSSDNSWLSTLIQVIGDTINKILDLLGNAFDTIFNGIIDLIKSLGIDLLGVFTSIFNNIIDFFDNLDLTTGIWVLPTSWTNNLQGITGATNNILNVWINNGLGLMIFIPLLVWLIGVIL